MTTTLVPSANAEITENAARRMEEGSGSRMYEGLVQVQNQSLLLAV